MGFEKFGISISKEVFDFARTGGKSFLSAMHYKAPINIKGLYYESLNIDTVQLSKQVKRWGKDPDNYIPNCNIPKSAIVSHHKVDGINSAIRDVKNLKKGIIDDCEMFGGYQAIKIDKEFAMLTPLEKDCIGYRIVGRSNSHFRNKPFDIIENAKIGDTIILDDGCAYAFQQESLISLNNYNLRNPMLEIIRIPEGARVSRNMEHGGEILMPRSAEYKLISKENTSEGIKIVLEYILPNSKYPKDIEQIKKIALQHIDSMDEFNKKYAQKIVAEIEKLEL